jgi:ribosome-associated protein
MIEDRLLVINDDLIIPLAELQYRFSTSGGPGGQHANRAATRATVLFDVAQSPSLSAGVRARILRKLANRIDQDGILAVSAQESRSQHHNRELAIARLQMMLAETLKEPKRRRKTRPSRAAKERRLAEKRRRSRQKKERRRDHFPD